MADKSLYSKGKLADNVISALKLENVCEYLSRCARCFVAVCGFVVSSLKLGKLEHGATIGTLVSGVFCFAFCLCPCFPFSFIVHVTLTVKD